MKMQIIGHRGAAGIALENSQTAFKKAVALGVPEVELDVRLTKDKVLVVNHDARLLRTAHDGRVIRKHTWKELADVRLNDGSPLLRLEDALEILGDTTVMIEIKDAGSQTPLLKVLDKFPGSQVVIASFKHRELVKLKKLRPELEYYPLAIFWPGEAVRTSRRNNLGGVGVPYWALNPLSYLIIKHSGLKAYTYTANSRLVVKIFAIFYPQVAICTNHPERFIKGGLS